MVLCFLTRAFTHVESIYKSCVVMHSRSMTIYILRLFPSFQQTCRLVLNKQCFYERVFTHRISEEAVVYIHHSVTFSILIATSLENEQETSRYHRCIVVGSDFHSLRCCQWRTVMGESGRERLHGWLMESLSCR